MKTKFSLCLLMVLALCNISYAEICTFTLTGSLSDDFSTYQLYKRFGSGGFQRVLQTSLARIKVQCGMEEIWTASAIDKSGNESVNGNAVVVRNPEDITPPPIPTIALVAIEKEVNDPGAYFAAPQGTATGDGSRGNPWDLTTAFNMESLPPGSVILLMGGRYYNVPDGGTLGGTSAEPILVKSAPGEWATLVLSSGWRPTGNFVIYRDFEITSEPGVRDTHKSPFVPSGSNQKYINMVIHDLPSNGIGTINQAHKNVELYGNIVYHNGYTGPDRMHGHGFYIQNDGTGIKILADNVLWANAHTGIQLFGQNGLLKNILIDGNILIRNGAAGITIGSGTVVDGIEVTNNHTYYSHIAAGSKSGIDGDVTITGNYIMGGLFALQVYNWATANVSENTIWAPVLSSYFIGSTDRTYWDRNTYIEGDREAQFRLVDGNNRDHESWKNLTGFDAESVYVVPSANKPEGTKVFVQENKYESGRGMVTIYNWDLRESVGVNVTSFLEQDSSYEIYDAQNYLAGPLKSGTYDGEEIVFPMTGLEAVAPFGTGLPTLEHTAPEFAVFIVKGPVMQ